MVSGEILDLSGGKGEVDYLFAQVAEFVEVFGKMGVAIAMDLIRYSSASE
ncbi:MULTISPECIES: hypothetical protein [Okeania]|nr:MULTISPECIES: hypothetical protein [Okeania]NET13635.1 hypothetical protein [Okeania sp. SIO1H6]NES75511.1 hypothetical protein [Okeania sp. SIO1H4]NES92067.1 hypothetical protein [Okeania sp. SIO2B9]NET17938.1 hypothetical protein [Okeania sp. SIO1H5]NET77382.1 hypothetical protein [Okeania sp. SIO1F9]